VRPSLLLSTINFPATNNPQLTTRTPQPGSHPFNLFNPKSPIPNPKSKGKPALPLQGEDFNILP
jgi:hypothetical protein